MLFGRIFNVRNIFFIKKIIKKVDNPPRNNIEKSMKQKKADRCQLINHKDCLLLNYHSFQYFTFLLIYKVFQATMIKLFEENNRIINEWQMSLDENDR